MLNHKPYLLSALLTGAALTSGASAQEPSALQKPSLQQEDFVNYNTHSGRVSRFRALHSGFGKVESRIKVAHEGKEVAFPVYTLPQELQEKYSDLIDFDDKPTLVINAPERIYYVDTSADLLVNAFKFLKAFVINNSKKSKVLNMDDVRSNEISNRVFEDKDLKVFIASESSWGIIKVAESNYGISEDDVPEFVSNLEWEDHQKLKSQMNRPYNRHGIGMEMQAFGPKEMNFFADWAFVTGSRFRSALFFKDKDSAKVKFVALDKLLQLSCSDCIDETKAKAETIVSSLKAKISKGK